MINREFLQLAHTYNPDKDFIAGKLVSEKLDGQRFFWDACTRGMPISKIPWANTEKSNAVPYSTGLWTRYGNPIVAPDFWLDNLPDFMVEGELFVGYGLFQYLMSVTRCTINLKVDEWSDIKAMIFDSPHPRQVFMDGRINNTQYRKIFKDIDFGTPAFSIHTPFRSRYKFLKDSVPINETVRVHEQVMLPHSSSQAKIELERFFEEVLNKGGEGLIIKNANDIWFPKRVKSVLKWKPWHDMEATVIGYKWGEETDKGSKLLGMMGSVECEITEAELIDGLQLMPGVFNASGFTNEERVMVRIDPSAAVDHGKSVVGFHNPLFPIGSKITIKFREVTDAGLPKEARYWRKPENS